jgi:formate-dependent nitrite reductase membrane component NrfD
MVQVAYSVDHQIPWHWPVPAYLVTKALASGVFMLLALAAVFGHFDADAMFFGGLLGIVALVATTILLVVDLERPERFWTILVRPQWKSWLTRGAFVLVAFALAASGWWGLETLSHFGVVHLPSPVRLIFAVATLPLAIGAAIYTAFLFAQAEGRDLWQSPLLPVHLLVQAAAMGAALVLVVSCFTPIDETLLQASFVAFAGLLVLDLFVMVFGEVAVPHASEVAALAAHEIRAGAFRHWFWLGAVLFGRVVPLAVLVFPVDAALLLSVGLSVVGLWAWEHAFVSAPQRIPNS